MHGADHAMQRTKAQEPRLIIMILLLLGTRNHCVKISKINRIQCSLKIPRTPPHLSQNSPYDAFKRAKGHTKRKKNTIRVQQNESSHNIHVTMNQAEPPDCYHLQAFVRPQVSQTLISTSKHQKPKSPPCNASLLSAWEMCCCLESSMVDRRDTSE